MADVDSSSVLEFHHSPGRRRRAMAIVAMIATALVAAYAVVFDEPWWQPLLRSGCFGVAAGLMIRWQLRRQPRLPLRLTDEALQMTVPDGTVLTIDWANVARAEVRGRLGPRLVVEPLDRQLTRPPLRPGQWSTPGRGPYELIVPVASMTPDRHTLSRELAKRLATT
ncbi:hypothetical protein [Micromonospora sp. NPDC049274]|uniref:hypothetical protein n=1 Tax=Micromonospora sp. NPDC049274 TaxID=3154829 RepID=UPI00342D3DC8